jgi:UDP:flavonoid glycosyltransferase YjiC (YdhE family)
VFNLGVGPKPIPQKKLTVQGLANAIREAIDHQKYHQRAIELGEKIRAEDGVGQAVDWISDRLRTSH